MTEWLSMVKSGRKLRGDSRDSGGKAAEAVKGKKENGKADECRVGGVGNTRRGGVWRRRAGEGGRMLLRVQFLPAGPSGQPLHPGGLATMKEKKENKKEEVQRCPSLPENQGDRG